MVSTLERDRAEDDTIDYSMLDLSNPRVLLETLQKLRQIVIQGLCCKKFLNCKNF